MKKVSQIIGCTKDCIKRTKITKNIATKLLQNNCNRISDAIYISCFIAFLMLKEACQNFEMPDLYSAVR